MECSYCFKNISDKKHMPRHMRVCKVKNDELTLLKNENSAENNAPHVFENKGF